MADINAAKAQVEGALTDLENSIKSQESDLPKAKGEIDALIVKIDEALKALDQRNLDPAPSSVPSTDSYGERSKMAKAILEAAQTELGAPSPDQVEIVYTLKQAKDAALIAQEQIEAELTVRAAKAVLGDDAAKILSDDDDKYQPAVDIAKSGDLAKLEAAVTVLRGAGKLEDMLKHENFQVIKEANPAAQERLLDVATGLADGTPDTVNLIAGASAAAGKADGCTDVNVF